MLAMQIMLDIIMDLMERISREAATIVEMEGRRTLTSKEILAASCFILHNCKDAMHGSAQLCCAGAELFAVRDHQVH